MLAAILLALGLLSTQYVSINLRYAAIGVFGVLAYFVSVWALYEDLGKVGWVSVVPLPAMYAVSVALFYFLLPEKVLSRVVIVGLFGLGMYALYLTGNIFLVAAVRTIQLLRAAQAVGFLLTLLTGVLFYNTIYSLRLPFWENGVLVLLVSLTLMLPALWSVNLPERIEKDLLVTAGGLGSVLMMLAMAISFLPLTVWVSSLFLATGVYVGVGIMQNELSGRLFSRTLQEYVGVGVLVFLATMLVTVWK